MSDYRDPHDDPGHDEWVKQGHCPAISSGKAWCQGRVGHRGPHSSPYRNGSGDPRTVWWES